MSKKPHWLESRVPTGWVSPSAFKENQHFKEAEKFNFGGGHDLLEDRRPRNQKGHFEIEEDKNDGDKVVANIEPHPRIFEGLAAAFPERRIYTLFMERIAAMRLLDSAQAWDGVWSFAKK